MNSGTQSLTQVFSHWDAYSGTQFSDAQSIVTTLAFLTFSRNWIQLWLRSIYRPVSPAVVSYPGHRQLTTDHGAMDGRPALTVTVHLTSFRCHASMNSRHPTSLCWLILPPEDRWWCWAEVGIEPLPRSLVEPGNHPCAEDTEVILKRHVTLKRHVNSITTIESLALQHPVPRTERSFVLRHVLR